jgi:nickel-dependent lactate racemase
MKHRIEYGDQDLLVEIPPQNLAFEIGPKEGAIEPQEAGEISRALAAPIGTPPLSQIVRAGQTVAIIVDDHTRLTPTDRILPFILDELNKGGVSDSGVRIIIASGTHRAMTHDEKVEKLGQPILDRLTVLDHDCLNNDKLLDYGTTDHGVRILVNTDAMATDVRLAIGTIFPHFPAGWSAGAKMLLPGIAGQDTVAQFHLLGATHDDTHLGQIDTITRHEMEAFASRVGLHFIFNVVLDKDGHLLRAFAGDFIQAHRAGVMFARSIYEVEVSQPADVLISSTSPIDHDYFQVMKGLYSAEVCTKPGGEIIVVSPLYEGMAATHMAALEVTPLTMNQALSKIRNHEYEDSSGAAIATYQIRLRDRFSLSVVSQHLPLDVARQLGVELYSDPSALQAILDRRLRANPGLKIGILHQSTEVVPRVRTAQGVPGG